MSKALLQNSFQFLTSPHLFKTSSQCSIPVKNYMTKYFKIQLLSFSLPHFGFHFSDSVQMYNRMSFRIYHILLPFLWSFTLVQQNLPLFFLIQSRFNIPHLHLFCILNIIVKSDDWNWSFQSDFFFHNSARSMAITYGNSLTTYKEWRPLFLIILQQNPHQFLAFRKLSFSIFHVVSSNSGKIYLQKQSIKP